MLSVHSSTTFQGGRLVAARTMVSDLYVFDLETFIWGKVHINSEDEIPQPRYFHSTDTCERFV